MGIISLSARNLKSDPPPEPPMGQYGAWELQYCNLNGWVWVRKDTYQVSNSPSPSRQKQKRRRLCGCFKSKPRHQEPPMVIMPPRPVQESKSEIRSEPSSQKKHADDSCTCSCPCCCNDFDDLCPCMLVCCPCNDDCSVEKCPCKNATTQTHTELKDTSTVMSKVEMPKPKRNCQCKCRAKKVMCVKAVCCPCAQNTCCHCVLNSNQNKCCYDRKSRDSGRRVSLSDNKNVDNIINLCLTSDLCKPNLNSILNYKSTDYNALQKSLDILLKNNSNILTLINEKKTLKRESRTPNFLDLNQSISCLSLDNPVQKVDTEHSNLLTAVCDAILSSHKFENEGINSRKNPSSMSMGQVSVNSLNTEKILEGLHFSQSTNFRKETGAQVNDPLRKTKIVNKIPRSRNRSSTVPRMFKKSVRYVNLTTQECRGNPSNTQTLEELLASTNFDFNNSAVNDRSNQDRQNVLEITSPPFTDYDSPENTEKSYFRENK